MTSALRSPDPERLQVLEMEVREEAIIVRAATTTLGACCPLCQHSSNTVHSHYVRTLADLPCSGFPVRWHIQVRRYKCLNTSCSRKIFVERLHPGAPAYARRWLRQKSLLPLERLREKQQEQLQKLRSHDNELNMAYELAQRFRNLLNQRSSAGFEQWLEEALACDIAEIRSFARGLVRDKKAVRAGLDQPWSQGQVEAQVHRLKLIKRQSYGRATFDLLRVRVLHPTLT